MADLTVTPANVLAGSNAKKILSTAGETITAGQPVVLDPTARKYVKADSNHATAALRVPSGIALNGASLNQPLQVQAGDGQPSDITIGATLTPGTTYYMSDTPGGICPLADVGTGEYATIIGIAKSATVLSLGINASGVAL